MAKDLLRMLSAVAADRVAAEAAADRARIGTMAFVREAISQGVSKAEVGRWLGVSRQAVQRWCK